MSPERLYEICLRYARRVAHDQQAAEATANYAAAEIWFIENKPADAHQDEVTGDEGIWHYWARYYTAGHYSKEFKRRDQRILVEEADATPTDWDPFNKDDADYIEMLAGMGQSDREVERGVEFRETKDELYRMIDGDLLTPAQHKAMIMTFEGLSPEEIAEVNGYSVKHAYDLQSAARIRIRATHPDIGDGYGEYLLQKRPIHAYRNKFKSWRDPETTLAYNLRKGISRLDGMKRGL